MSPIRVLLAHDVTLLALKHGLLARAPLAPPASSPSSPCGEGTAGGAKTAVGAAAEALEALWLDSNGWPPYASALVLELSHQGGMDHELRVLTTATPAASPGDQEPLSQLVEVASLPWPW